MEKRCIIFKEMYYIYFEAHTCIDGTKIPYNNEAKQKRYIVFLFIIPYIMLSCAVCIQQERDKEGSLS